MTRYKIAVLRIRIRQFFEDKGPEPVKYDKYHNVYLNKDQVIPACLIRIWSLPDQIHNPDCLFLRAQKTLATVLEESGQPDLPVEKTWRLNER